MAKRKKEVSYLLWGFVILFSFVMFLFSTDLIVTVISLIVGFLCGNKNVKWANKINKSVNWAYVIGFSFGLFGLLFYYLYYRDNKK